MNLDAHEITPGLWVGSAPPCGKTLSRLGFGVLALCAFEHQPDAEDFPRVFVMRTDLIDDGSPLTKAQFEKSLFLSAHLCREILAGKRALVTCMQGRNRSGFVAALTYARLTGCDGRTAIRAIQTKRDSPFGPALVNKSYVEALNMVPPRESPRDPQRFIRDTG